MLSIIPTCEDILVCFHICFALGRSFTGEGSSSVLCCVWGVQAESTLLWESIGYSVNYERVLL